MANPFGGLITDGRDGPSLRESRGRRSGTRNYRVNTHDEGVAIVAPGVPIYGAQWSGQLPLLRVVDRECRYTHGTNDPGDNVGGWCKVRVEYEEDPVGLVAPRPGDSYTEPASTSSSVTVKYGLNADGSGDGIQNAPIANGQGASKDVGGMLLDVHVFLSQDSNATLARVWPLLKGKVFNANPMSLPPMLTNTSSQRILIPRGYAQYFDFNRRVVDGVVDYVHTLKIVPDGQYVLWRKESDKGHAFGPLIASPIYELANYDDLWPGP